MAIKIKSILDLQVEVLRNLEQDTSLVKDLAKVYNKYFTGEDFEILRSAVTTRHKYTEELLEGFAKSGYEGFYSKRTLKKNKQLFDEVEAQVSKVSRSKKFLKAIVKVTPKYEGIHIYLVPLGSFGGCSAKYNGEYHVFINPSRFHLKKTDKELRVLFVHESIHAHHIRTSGINVSDAGWGSKVYYALFMEGLATFFTRKFCDVSFEEVVGCGRLGVEKQQMANEILKELGEEKPRSLEYFTTSKEYPKKVPLGYALGYELIEELFKTYTFEKLCVFKEKKIKEECEKWLKRVSIISN